MLLCSLIRVRKSIWDDTTIIFAWKKRIRRERKKLFTTTTELFEYKHKTTAINIEETHII